MDAFRTIVRISTVEQGDEVVAWMSEQTGYPVSDVYEKNPDEYPYIGIYKRGGNFGFMVTDGAIPSYFHNYRKCVECSYDVWKDEVGDSPGRIIEKSKRVRALVDEMIRALPASQ